MIKIKGYALAYQAGVLASHHMRAVLPESRKIYQVLQKDTGIYILPEAAVTTLTMRQKLASTLDLLETTALDGRVNGALAATFSGAPHRIPAANHARYKAL